MAAVATGDLGVAGQVMSTRVDIFPQQYIQRLQKLQDSLDPIPTELVKSKHCHYPRACTSSGSSSSRSPVTDSVHGVVCCAAAVVRQELLEGEPLELLFSEFDPEPLGSASIAQVKKSQRGQPCMPQICGPRYPCARIASGLQSK